MKTPWIGTSWKMNKTRGEARAFAEALKAADRVIVVETYVARGAPDPEASARRIAQLVGSKAVFIATGGAAAREIQGIARSGDLILCCGAGPVDRIARAVLN
jgi:UDP-N-acetylmuramate-alanine ligase